jgi:hypothetical protein
MALIALALSGGGSKGDFEVGAVRYLFDQGIVPNIVTSTSVGSVSALKVMEGPTGIPGLESAWLSLLGSGDMFAREPWTTDPDIEGTILSAATALLSPPPTSSNLDGIISLVLMNAQITAAVSAGSGGGIDLSGVDLATVSRIAGFLPIAGQALGLFIGSTVDTVEKVINIFKTEVSIFNLNPLEARVRTQLNQAAVAAWAANGNRLRMATVGLASGRLRFITESGDVVERDGFTIAYDTENAGIPLRTTLLTGMLASASIPVVFRAIPFGDDLYVDGGIRATLPTEVAASLGATTIYGVQAAVKMIGRRPELKTAKLLDIAVRSLMDITIDEIAYSDSNRVGTWGANVNAMFIQPNVDIHDSFTIYPAYVRNRMAYGYMCAADVVNPQPPGVGIGAEAADEISIIRTAIARLEAYLEGRPIPPTMTKMARLPPPAQAQVIADIKTLKMKVMDQISRRIGNNNAMPPTDTTWSDHREWWKSWEQHPLKQEIAPANKHVCAISCMQDRLDAFIVSQAGTILQATWRASTNEQWQGWYQVQTGMSAPGSLMSATSRHNGSIDLAVAGTDGTMFAAQWDQAIADSEGWPGWHGFWQIANGKVPIGSAVAIVSRRPEFLDVFGVGTDGGIYTGAADPNNATWQGMWRVGNLLTVPDARISAVSRSLDHLDIFVTDASGSVNWSHWDPSLAGGWAAWTPPIGAGIIPGQPIAAVSRSNGLIDLFIVDRGGNALTAGFDPSTGWGGWWTIPGVIPLLPGTELTAVSRQPDFLDVFATDAVGRVMTTHWDPSSGWVGWTQVLSGVVAAGTPITAVSRGPGLIDIFCIGNDGFVVTAGFDPASGWAGFWRLEVDLPINPLEPLSVSGGIG